MGIRRRIRVELCVRGRWALSIGPRIASAFGKGTVADPPSVGDRLREIRDSLQLIFRPIQLGLTVLILAACSAALAEPGFGTLRDSSLPLLQKAKAVDIAFQPPAKARQREAESLYLEFITQNPTHPLVTFLHFHLGQMYSGYVTKEWGDLGSVKDEAKARHYFVESVKHHPPEKISSVLMNSMVCAAALAPTREEKLQEYGDHYRWLAKMKKEDLATRLWFTDEEQAILRKYPPERVARMLDTFWQSRDGAMRVAETNMIAIAEGDPTKTRQLLDEIAAEFPDAPLGQTAAQKRAEFKEDLLDLGEDRRPPLFATILLAAVLPALLVAGILAWQRIKKARAGGPGGTRRT